MQQNRQVDMRRIQGLGIFEREQGVAEYECEADAQQESENAGNQSDCEILHDQLSDYTGASGFESASHTDLGNSLPQPALGHAAKIDCRYDEQDNIHDQP